MKPTHEEIKAAHAEGGVTGNDICGALRHLGAGDSKWDWLSQEAAIMIETQAAEIQRLQAVIVSDTHVLLTKRPVAFRYRNEADEWVLTRDEAETQCAADAQGLYARYGK